ncbi:hypothetical protein K7X08_031696 [Anisodus acutangulus]|uniref:Uncharacterized protein n=1 Tax=Anisodus acutangulus TaxID=402998 RepID=A0A9Q1MMR0_9SOLA|nr:hypothetical protein K7X08_031696 [Anisodus acutangulus]
MSVKSCVTKSEYGNGFLVEESDDDERIHSVTVTKTGGNKRSREPEDVNWDKRRRLKMYFYLAAEGLYLSCIKDPNNEESDDDERIHSVTATKTGGNKRSQEPEDVNWDKRRRLKMYFYLAAEGLYLSQTKDPNNGKKELDTQSDEVTEVSQNPKLG